MKVPPAAGPLGEAQRWAEAFRFQNDCVEGGRIATAPKNEAALFLGKTDGHTNPRWGLGHIFGSASAMLPAAAPGRNAVPAGLGCPSLQLGINTGNDTRLLLEGSLGQPQGADSLPEPSPMGLRAAWLTNLVCSWQSCCKEEGNPRGSDRLILPLLLDLNDPRRGSACLTLQPCRCRDASHRV